MAGWAGPDGGGAGQGRRTWGCAGGARRRGPGLPRSTEACELSPADHDPFCTGIKSPMGFKGRGEELTGGHPGFPKRSLKQKTVRGVHGRKEER